MLTLTVTGHLAADAILRDYNGTQVISFTVASNNRFKTTSGEVKEETTFIRCALWNTTEKLSPLFFKGRIVTVTGTLKTSVYADRVNLDLRVNNFQVFGKGNQPDEMQTQPDRKTQPANVERYGEHNDPNDELLKRIATPESFAPEEVTDDLPF